ncbi:hypothetical protein Ciccas_000456 [Cichlidogyrus casuarinus]|uniref:Uncharacterized protein n=1 Tax=Cichlidogyrus casuarinus TaxID=1844966 RepID=A0ABD2QMU5_9PLAT
MHDIGVLLKETAKEIGMQLYKAVSPSKSCCLDRATLEQLQSQLDQEILSVIETENRCHDTLIRLLELNFCLERPIQTSEFEEEASVSVSSNEGVNADLTVDSGINGSESVSHQKDHVSSCSDGTYDHTSPELDHWQASPDMARPELSSMETTCMSGAKRRIRWADYEYCSRPVSNFAMSVQDCLSVDLSDHELYFHSTLPHVLRGSYSSGEDNNSPDSECHDWKPLIRPLEPEQPPQQSPKQRPKPSIQHRHDSIPEWKRLADALIREIKRTPICPGCRRPVFASNQDSEWKCSTRSVSTSSSSSDRETPEGQARRKRGHTGKKRMAMRLMTKSYPPLGPTEAEQGLRETMSTDWLLLANSEQSSSPSQPNSSSPSDAEGLKQG